MNDKIPQSLTPPNQIKTIAVMDKVLISLKYSIGGHRVEVEFDPPLSIEGQKVTVKILPNE